MFSSCFHPSFEVSNPLIYLYENANFKTAKIPKSGPQEAADTRLTEAGAAVVYARLGRL